MRRFLATTASIVLAAFALVTPLGGPAYAATGYSVTCTSPSNGYSCVSFSGYSGQSVWGYPVNSPSGAHNCTNYVAYRLAQNGAANPGNLGNATDWDNSALAKGFTVDGNAVVGSVAQWEGNTGPATGVPEGHVAYVEAVTDTYIDISQDAWGGTTSTARILRTGTYWPSHFIHIKDVGGSGAPTATVSFQANTGSLWRVGNGGPGNANLGMMAGTSPSTTTLSNGSVLTAFQANTGNLWVVGSGAPGNMNLGMMAGTSPSIAAVPGGGFRVAFQANTGSLWVVGTSAPGNMNLGMMAGTSPSITTLTSGGYQAAFQANTGNLWVVGSNAPGNMNLGMMAGTSPSIAAVPGGGFRSAFQANTGNLWVVGTNAPGNMNLGMAASTSPALVTLTGGGYQAAFQANTGNLWVVGTNAPGNMNLGMMAGTSPSLAPQPSNNFTAAFQANTGNLWSVGTIGAGDWKLGMASLTSPCVASTIGASCPPGAPRIRQLQAPSVEGNARVGMELKATPGKWSTTATYSYQWLSDGVALSGATTPTYTPNASAMGARISVRVTASRSGYASGSGTSAQTSTVAPGVIANKAVPKIVGKRKVGKKLKAAPGAWSPGGLTIAYQWLRDGSVIPRATARSFRLTRSSKGHRISVRVTVSKVGYTTVSRTSAVTTRIG